MELYTMNISTRSAVKLTDLQSYLSCPKLFDDCTKLLFIRKPHSGFSAQADLRVMDLQSLKVESIPLQYPAQNQGAGNLP